MSSGFKLPGYLRLLLLTYKLGWVRLSLRKKLGFTMNDVYMLEAYGLVKVLRESAEGREKTVHITEKGRKVVEEQIAKYVC